MSLNTHAWDAPNCPECETEVFVSNVGGQKFECNFCGETFKHDSNGETNHIKLHEKYTNRGQGGIPKYSLEHAKLLEFLQQYDRNYFKVNNIVHDYGITSQKWVTLITTIKDKDLVGIWGSKSSSNPITYHLTDKGKNVNPKELIET